MRKAAGLSWNEAGISRAYYSSKQAADQSDQKKKKNNEKLQWSHANWLFLCK